MSNAFSTRIHNLLWFPIDVAYIATLPLTAQLWYKSLTISLRAYIHTYILFSWNIYSR